MNSATYLIASLWRRLPTTTATAPFCPSQVRETIPIPLSAPLLKRFFRYAGIGFLVSVGYLAPGTGRGLPRSLHQLSTEAKPLTAEQLTTTDYGNIVLARPAAP
jgi:hypothetical protein